jgi:hypothetical protein
MCHQLLLMLRLLHCVLGLHPLKLFVRVVLQTSLPAPTWSLRLPVCVPVPSVRPPGRS